MTGSLFRLTSVRLPSTAGHDKLTGMNVASAQTADTRTEDLAGLVERVTFHNEENGFCVLRLKARGRLCARTHPVAPRTAPA